MNLADLIVWLDGFSSHDAALVVIALDEDGEGYLVVDVPGALHSKQLPITDL